MTAAINEHTNTSQKLKTNKQHYNFLPQYHVR